MALHNDPNPILGFINVSGNDQHVVDGNVMQHNENMTVNGVICQSAIVPQESDEILQFSNLSANRMLNKEKDINAMQQSHNLDHSNNKSDS